MKPNKYNRLCATIKNLRRELYEERRTYREVINYQNREINALRKQLADIRAANESELDQIINRLHATAKALHEQSEMERKLYTNGTSRI